MLFVPLLVGIAALVAALAIWFGVIGQRKRRQRAAAVAASHGLTYVGNDPYRMVQTLGFGLFEPGSAKKVSNLMRGPRPDGGEVRAFEYQYTINSGNDSAATYWFSCGLTSLPAPVPHLVIEPESILRGLREVLGLLDQQFESEEFNRRWKVRCDDPRFASAAVSPTVMEFLLDDTVSRVRFELRGPWLLFSVKRDAPEFLPTAISWAEALRTRLPAVVWSLYGPTPPPPPASPPLPPPMRPPL
jgi:hypothetical protein